MVITSERKALALFIMCIETRAKIEQSSTALQLNIVAPRIQIRQQILRLASFILKLHSCALAIILWEAEAFRQTRLFLGN